MMVITSGIAALVCIAVSVLALLMIHTRLNSYRTQETISAQFRTVNLLRRNELPPVLPYYNTAAIQIVDHAGRPVAATKELTGKPPMAGFVPSPGTVTDHRVLCPPEGLSGCQTVVVTRIPYTGGDWTIYAATPAVPWYVGGPAAGMAFMGSAVLVALTALGTSRTVSRTLAPVAAIRAKFAEITASDPGRRLPVPESGDEFRALAETANAALDRLEASLKQLQRFTSDASHDLRSPITAIRARLEEALLHPHDTDWPATAREVLGSLDRLQAIVTDLLTLARLDAGVPREMDSIDLPGLVSAELKRYRRVKDVKTDLEAQVTVVGDRLRLNRLLTNLLDNAERHARSQIKVVVRAERDDAVIEVQDDGCGIPRESREVVFQRFARLAAARHKDVNGTGLGLPIAREIAKAHGGSLTIEDSPVGARFVCRIPLNPED
ncbi:MAG TPA: HAMP domain-containing sensor histidine kinase [Streptosporangiaceae bacterium]